MSVSSVAEGFIRPKGRRMLEAIASEVKYQIFSYLPQETLYSLLHVSPAVSEEAAVLLYYSPKFRTTFRLAQFVTTVSHSKRYADMVRVFRVSDRKEAENRAHGFASWREWKYREIPLYAALFTEPKKNACTVAHPGANELFNKTNASMPVGLVVHVLASCRNIRQVSLQGFAPRHRC